MPIQAEHLNDDELIVYFRETLFLQGGLSSGWRRTAAEDCMAQITKRLKAKPAELAPAPEAPVEPEAPAPAEETVAEPEAPAEKAKPKPRGGAK